LLTVAAFVTTAGAISAKAAVVALAVAVSAAANAASMAVARHCIVPYSACDIVQQADASLCVEKMSLPFREVTRGINP